MIHVIVDPVSTGANLAHDLLESGHKIIAVWSPNISDTMRHMIIKGLRTDYVQIQAKSECDSDIKHLISQLRQYETAESCIASVVAGSEPAVHFADILSEAMGVRTNGTEKSMYRREKYSMGEAVRNAGIRAVTQRKCLTLEEGLEFARSHSAIDKKAVLVLKPTLSAGSDDVYKVNAIDETLFIEKFETILGKINRLNVSNDCVLVQEFLYGEEYVVDTVSLDGVHRLAGCWRYMKKAVNGADFVYYGMELIDGNSTEGGVLFEYISKVLDALHIRHYAGHAEVMLDPIRGPCLVEIGARLQGGEGLFILAAERCVGLSQVSLMAKAMCDPEHFQSLPLGKDTWNAKDGFATVLDLVSYQDGIVESIDEDALQRIHKHTAVLQVANIPEPGSRITKTIDCFSSVGSVTLWSGNKSDVTKAIADIHEITRDLFRIKQDDFSSSSGECSNSNSLDDSNGDSNGSSIGDSTPDSVTDSIGDGMNFNKENIHQSQPSQTTPTFVAPLK